MGRASATLGWVGFGDGGWLHRAVAAAGAVPLLTTVAMQMASLTRGTTPRQLQWSFSLGRHFAGHLMSLVSRGNTVVAAVL